MFFPRTSPGRLIFKPHNPSSILWDAKKVMRWSTGNVHLIVSWGAPRDLLYVPLQEVLGEILGSVKGVILETLRSLNELKNSSVITIL